MKQLKKYIASILAAIGLIIIWGHPVYFAATKDNLFWLLEYIMFPGHILISAFWIMLLVYVFNTEIDL